MSDTNAVQSLAELYDQCASSFQCLLSRLSDPVHRTRQHDSVSLDAAAEEYGKLRIWAEQTRVVLPPGSRGSLDELVRDRANPKRILVSTLGQLANLLKSATNATGDISNEPRTLPRTAASQGLMTLDLDGQENAVDPVNPSHQQSQNKLSTTIRHISEQVRLLYDASALLKRAGLAGKYLRSNQSISGDESNVQELFDRGHIREKLLQWYNDWAAQNKEDYRGRISSAAASIQVPEELILRLAWANSMRRKQLQYWLQHADSPETVPVHVDVEARLQTQAVMPPSIIDEVIAPKAQKLPPPTEAARTTRSKVSLSTAIMSAVNDAQEDVPVHTEYEESVVGKFTPTRVPLLPRVAYKATDFKCPYCGLSLQSSVMQSRRTWKTHVFRDLRPYVCTFSNCTSAARLYHARHDWIYHENQMHRRQWTCSIDCHQVFSDPQSFVMHLRNSHSERVLDDKLHLILTLSERPMSDEKIERCSLCPTSLPLSRLLPHVAQHLEQLSLFILSCNTNDADDADNGSNASHQAEDDRRGHFHGVSDGSSVDDRRSIQASDEDNDSIAGTTGPANEESVLNIPPPDDSQLWTKLFSTTHAYTQSADSDPVLIDLQKKQANKSKVESTSEVETAISLAEKEMSEIKDAEGLRNFMSDHMATTEFNGTTQRFLTRTDFERATSQSVILQMARAASISKEEEDELVLKVCRDYRKIFACCIYSRLSMDFVKVFVDLEISDAQLPLRFEDLPEQMESQHQFVEYQRCLNTAYFTLGSFHALDDEWTIPIDYDVSQPLWQGYCSEIYEVRIPFGEDTFHPERGPFAMRIYRFEKEHNVDIILDVLRVKLKHAVKCLAAFTMSSSLYMLYNKSSGNLEQYMSKASSLRLSDGELVYQLRGVAMTVDKLQKSNFSDLGNLHRPKHPPRLSVINIHPENILVFPGRLEMMRLWVEPFQIVQPARSSGRVSAVLSPAYRPPEPLEAANADSIAGWSLGCLYLEILVWHIKGYDSLRKFRESRERPVKPGGRRNRAFYYFAERGPHARRAQLREEVTEMFSDLRREASPPLISALQVVQEMMLIDPQARLRADEFKYTLENLPDSLNLNLYGFHGAVSYNPVGAFDFGADFAESSEDEDEDEWTI